jgi:hypothetical protein
VRVTVSIALAAIALAIAPTQAFAQSASDQATAEALFKQARDLIAAGKYSDACPKLAESQRLDPGTGTLLNLATCYEKNGQIASAWVTYKGAVTAAQNANEADRAKLARTRAAALEPTLPTLTIVVLPAADRPDLRVTRDGETVGRVAWGTPIPVDPGAHAVQANAPGHKAWQGQAQVVGAGAKVTIEIPALDADTQASPAAPTPLTAPAETPAPSTPGSTQRVIGLVVAGVGVLGLGAGGVFGVMAKSKNDSVPSQCNGSVCTATGTSSLDDAKSAATVSTVAFVAGGVAVAAGVILYIIAPRASSSTGLTVAPGSDGSVAGLTLRGVWR